jgi:uncharacterized protein (TIGR02145 family)
MIEGRILPWTEDLQDEGYPVWTDWEAGQRDVFFLDRDGVVDTTFNITPYDPGNPEDYTYIMNLILDLRNETWGQDTVTDIDGNVYETVQIGEQLWMKENLKVTHYNNGDEIPTGYSNSEWASLSTGAYTVYNDNEINADTYGYLYNWYAIDLETGVCPEGWHVPTDDEWTILSDYLGGSDIAGGKLKECTEGSCPESEYWNSPNEGATNESGFTGLPGGCRGGGSGSYLYLGGSGFFWSSTEYNSNLAWFWVPYYDTSVIYRDYDYKGYGSSVRCVMDEPEVGTILVPYSTGWNMVGLPVLVEDASYGTLFSDAVNGTLYGYEGSYYGSDVLEAGNGYWLVFTNDGSADISGEAITSLTISLSEGWNLIAGISSPVAVESISDPGSIIVSGTIYGYGGSYYNAEAIEPGKGYWLNSFADGEIILSSTAFAVKTVEQVNHLEGSNTLELSNGTHSSTLYFGKDVADEHKNSYSLPPTFPQMAFDARFTDNMKYIQDAGEISVINTNSRLTLNYSVNLDPGEHLKWVFMTNSGKEHILNGTGEITLPPETKGMSLEKRAIFPDVYALYQNYPNPFNPVTKITYQLPEESYVAVTIYNLAGQKVTTLVDGRRSAGFHAVDWYGENSKGESVASGLYFFRIEAENFSKTLKMLLLK